MNDITAAIERMLTDKKNNISLAPQSAVKPEEGEYKWLTCQVLFDDKGRLQVALPIMIDNKPFVLELGDSENRRVLGFKDFSAQKGFEYTWRALISKVQEGDVSGIMDVFKNLKQGDDSNEQTGSNTSP